ncbi:putative uncharacterized protein DDB_G0289263 [Oppia nitens]|uniref:putative uncharacterized protein DDB_G0289263 n=1 Tax=Oppia nitens TaxID=1686743 RepID=UPI0023DCA819|nr:putative uncharacterized protein DDB_G0289263 [Oppia nitens]
MLTTITMMATIVGNKTIKLILIVFYIVLLVHLNMVCCAIDNNNNNNNFNNDNNNNNNNNPNNIMIPNPAVIIQNPNRVPNNPNTDDSMIDLPPEYSMVSAIDGPNNNNNINTNTNSNNNNNNDIISADNTIIVRLMREDFCRKKLAKLVNEMCRPYFKTERRLYCDNYLFPFKSMTKAERRLCRRKAGESLRRRTISQMVRSCCQESCSVSTLTKYCQLPATAAAIGAGIGDIQSSPPRLMMMMAMANNNNNNGGGGGNGGNVGRPYPPVANYNNGWTTTKNGVMIPPANGVFSEEKDAMYGLKLPLFKPPQNF